MSRIRRLTVRRYTRGRWERSETYSVVDRPFKVNELGSDYGFVLEASRHEPGDSFEFSGNTFLLERIERTDRRFASTNSMGLRKPEFLRDGCRQQIECNGPLCQDTNSRSLSDTGNTFYKDFLALSPPIFRQIAVA